MYLWGNAQEPSLKNDFLGYISCDPYFRAHHHNELTFSMIYAYSEQFMLVFSHDEVVHGKGTLIGKMPGEIKDKFANLRLTYAYMLTHPGKKLLLLRLYSGFLYICPHKEHQW